MKSLTPRNLGLFAIITVGLLAVAPAAASDRRHHKPHHRSNHHQVDHHRVNHQRVDLHRFDHHRRDHRFSNNSHHRVRYGIDYQRYDRFELPRIIVRADAHRYDRFLDNDFYYRPHRHRHSVYNFPVRSDGHWVQRPYEYCDGSLFVSGRVTIERPRFSLSFGF